MVGSKTLWSFYATCVESVQPLQSVKTNQLAVLTVKNGLDPHMIIELEDGLKSCYLVMLTIFLWCILPLCLMWVGINLHLVVIVA
jgi:hypothetical protein